MTQTTNRVLIAVLSCHALRGHEQAIRDTWAKDVPPEVDLRFFLGLPDVSIGSDEVCLKVGDALDDLTQKTVALCAWSLAQGYDYVFKVDLDTLVRPHLLLQSGFENWDYSGGQFGARGFASGGAGYWMSKRAMSIVVAEVKEQEPWEDLYVSRALAKHGIEVHNNPQHKFMPDAVLDSQTITMHLSSIKGWGAKSNPEDMYRMYKEKTTGRWLRRNK